MNTPNFSAAHEWFSLGPTKNAVILREMCRYLDDLSGVKRHERTIGAALMRVNEILNMVDHRYRSQSPKHHYVHTTEWVKLEIKEGFKEHLVYDTIQYERTILRESAIPMDLVYRFAAVAKEMIHLRQVKNGLMKARPGTSLALKGQQIIDWFQTPSVQAARGYWQQEARKSMRFSVDVAGQKMQKQQWAQIQKDKATEKEAAKDSPK